MTQFGAFGPSARAIFELKILSSRDWGVLLKSWQRLLRWNSINCSLHFKNLHVTRFLFLLFERGRPPRKFMLIVLPTIWLMTNVGSKWVIKWEVAGLLNFMFQSKP